MMSSLHVHNPPQIHCLPVPANLSILISLLWAHCVILLSLYSHHYKFANEQSLSSWHISLPGDHHQCNHLPVIQQLNLITTATEHYNICLVAAFNRVNMFTWFRPGGVCLGSLNYALKMYSRTHCIKAFMWLAIVFDYGSMAQLNLLRVGL